MSENLLRPGTESGPGTPAAGVQLGLGLIGIGRPWGYIPTEVPPERDTIEFLEFAFRLGVRYFDTAASYGSSEARLGRFLRSLSPRERTEAVVATKFGEHWDEVRNEPYVDHSFAAFEASLGRSLERLEKIDVLQLHKTTPEALRSASVDRAWEYAASMGIPCLGPSVSDLESGRMACETPRFGIIQLPFNRASDRFAPIIDAAGARGMRVAVNRPFAMGKMLYDSSESSPAEIRVQAFRWILQRQFDGVILTGTKSKAHLEENWKAFREALRTGD